MTFRIVTGPLIAAAASLWLALPAAAEIDIQQVETPLGFKAWLVEEPSIPFTALEIRFKGGAALDAPDKRGATNLMVGLLEEGAGAYDAQSFAAESESLAASFGYDSSQDAVSVSARFLTENRDDAVELLRQSLIEPSFSEAALTRVRAQVISGIRSDA